MRVYTRAPRKSFSPFALYRSLQQCARNIVPWHGTYIYIYVYMYIYICIPGASFARSPHLVIVIRTARSNITIRSQTNSLAMPGRLPFTGRTVVSPVWPDLDRTWGAVTVGTHQTSRGWGLPLSLYLFPSFSFFRAWIFYFSSIEFAWFFREFLSLL